MSHPRPLSVASILAITMCVAANTGAHAQLLAQGRIDPVNTSAAAVTAEQRALPQERIEELPLDEQCRIQRAKVVGGDELKAFGCIWNRLALRTPKQAEQYFGGFGIGDAIGLSVGSDETALYTELLGDNIYLFSNVGYARVGFATQVTASEDSAGSTTVNQFFQAGGNAVLYAALPLRVRITYAGESANPKPVRRFDSAVTLALGADVPELGTPTTESAAYGRLGVQTTFTWRTADEDFRFFAIGNGGLTRGFSEKYYSNLSSDAEVDEPTLGIASGTATLGVDLAQIIRIGVRFSSSTFGPAQQKPQLSVQVLAK